MVRVSRG